MSWTCVIRVLLTFCSFICSIQGINHAHRAWPTHIPHLARDREASGWEKDWCQESCFSSFPNVQVWRCLQGLVQWRSMQDFDGSYKIEFYGMYQRAIPLGGLNRETFFFSFSVQMKKETQRQACLLKKDFVVHHSISV